jgi:hypothetical protein
LLLLTAFLLLGVPIDGSTVGRCTVATSAGADTPRDAMEAAALAASSPDCIPALTRQLADGGKSGYAAAFALALIGNPTAQDALYSALGRVKDRRLKTLAAFGASALGRPSDLAFLCSALEGEHFGDEWRPIEAAALSLAILQVDPCDSALRVGATDDGSIAGNAKRFALRVIADKPPCRARATDSPTASAIAAVLSCAVPRSDEAPAFLHVGANEVLEPSPGGWNSRPVAQGEAESLPTLATKVTLGPHGDRALVDVGLYFGPLNAIGYQYIVVRDADDWVVRGLRATWIS